jgi:hypothetical protein
LRRLLEHMLNGMLSERYRVVTIIAQNQDVRSLIFDKRAELIAAKKEMEQPILALLEAGQACGEFDATVPSRVLLVLFINLLNPHRYMELLESGQTSRDDLIQQITQLFFNGINAAPPRERDPE